MCINVIIQQKGVKFLFIAESVQSPFFLLITGRECSLICKGPSNSRLCPDSLAEHLVCKHVPPEQRVLFAGTSLLPYCGCINFLHYLRCTVWEGFTLVTVDVRIQVQGLGVLVTLETVIVILQYRVREVGSAWRMWMCHSTDRMWGGLSPWRLWTCNPMYRVWEHGHSRDWKFDPRCSVCERRLHWRLWICDPRCSNHSCGVTLKSVDV